MDFSQIAALVVFVGAYVLIATERGWLPPIDWARRSAAAELARPVFAA